MYPKQPTQQAPAPFLSSAQTQEVPWQVSQYRNIKLDLSYNTSLGVGIGIFFPTHPLNLLAEAKRHLTSPVPLIRSSFNSFIENNKVVF